MESFDLELPAQAPGIAPADAALFGVVSSGNLEVLVEAGPLPDRCRFHVETTAHGFTDVWQAVLADFAAGHRVGGLSFSIHDAGATPAVVSLRLAQALQSLEAS
ncbi:MAG: malonate decarboxylase acyl carrier protein [Betaproteobacteria bacterium]|nr:malonate decarboxylase acyl carrier protein [Betaproteobacteria bacterium]